jgi:hypothetical protein
MRSTYRDDLHNELSVNRDVEGEAELNVRDDIDANLDYGHDLRNNASNLAVVGGRVTRWVAACSQCRG